MISRLERAYLSTALVLALVSCGAPPAATESTSKTTAPTADAMAHAPATTSLPSQRLNQIVDDVLSAQYPSGFDAEHQCWKATYGEGDMAMAYCMRALPASGVMEGGRQVVYIATASAADIQGDADYRYGAIDPGILDAFRVAVTTDGRATITASAKGMAFGSAGDCGCVNADLVRLGPDIHGWVFSSGSTAQGITTGAHSLVAPVDDAFKDVGGIPQYVENDQQVEYRIAIGSDEDRHGWYPITVTKHRDSERLESRTLRFDVAAKRYRMPESF